jgi:amino acid transporter
MQRINAAWTVLGDVARRRAYDATLDASRAGTGPESGFRATGYGRVEFMPLDDTEYGRSTEEHPYRRSRTVPRWATMTPFGLFGLALVTLFGGVILNSRGVMGLGVVVLVVSVVAFFVIPLLALSAAERDRR